MNLTYYLEKPWVLGEYECWALVCDFYQREMGFTLPLVNLGSVDPAARRDAFRNADRSVYDDFERKAAPRHGDIVALCDKNDPRKAFCHVGVYLETPDGGRVMHSIRHAGTLIQSPDDLDCEIITFYRLKHV